MYRKMIAAVALTLAIAAAAFAVPATANATGAFYPTKADCWRAGDEYTFLHKGTGFSCTKSSRPTLPWVLTIWS